MVHFTGRAAQLAEIEEVLRRPRPEPVIVTGRPGIGRSALLREVAWLAAPRLGEVLVVDPDARRSDPDARRSGPDARRSGPAGRGGPRVVTTAAEIRAAARSTPRPIFIVDDAHEAPHPMLLELRDAHRRTGAALVISRPDTVSSRAPDPVDCLLYEPGLRIVPLPPLTCADVGEIVRDRLGAPAPDGTVAALHAAADGVPGLLRDLIAGPAFARGALIADGRWWLGADPADPLPLPARAREHLLTALRTAWRTLDLQRLPDLALLALRAGARAEAAPMWALVCLLRGQSERGLRLLDELRGEVGDGPGADRIDVARALLTAIGTGRVHEAGDLLRAAARARPAVAPRMHALAALLGTVLNAPHDEPATGTAYDPQAEVFARSAAAVAHLGGARPRQAIPHLRRAIIGAEALRDELPWLLPYLTGALIDALLLAGRLSEATEKAAEFHAERQGSGWDVAVSLSALISQAMAVRDREPA
ncbi:MULTISPECIES: hypothetical protein [Catenuloplanes]|uniref:AAA+ ATPase domain-containing protein n=1 Tax=Catenuloplanes niger TaxID=587534 RepID=A0AAE4A1K7_9ACTN|nr:hypothetical protein [Catenuloplanes niger]MDR7327570.1 hypothetical protein [Catenuloplanes niger]